MQPRVNKYHKNPVSAKQAWINISSSEILSKVSLT